MVRSGSSAKRHRQSLVVRDRNRCAKGMVRSLVKVVEKCLKELNKDSVQDAMRRAVKVMDTAARKGILKKNTVARKKSRLQLKVNKILLSETV